jgi:ATP-binding cassette subfamily F protein 3
LQTREALTDALAQFEGTLLLVSHDRHLLRATTDQFIIVADGKMEEFDGDLDDYKDWLYQTKLAKPVSAAKQAIIDAKESAKAAANEASAAKASKEAKAAIAAATPQTGDRREQKRQEAGDRQRLAGLRKPIENRIKRLEEQIAKLQEKKQANEVQMQDSGLYDAANKAKLTALLGDQAYIGKELVQLEEEWLAQQEALEQVG